MEKNSINDIYDILENNISSINYDRDIIKLLPLSNKSNESILDYEILFFRFSLTNLKIINNFDNYLAKDGVNEYLSQRAESVSNTYIKIRYFFILWHTTKNRIYGEKAIDLALGITLKVTKIDKKADFEIFYIVNLMCFLSNNIKYKLEQLRNYTICQFSSQKIEIYEKMHLFKLMVKYSKIYKVSDFEKPFSLCVDFMEHLRSENDCFFCLDLHAAIIKVIGKLKTDENLKNLPNVDEKFWHNELAKNYESFANYRMDDKTRIVPLNSLKDALKYYQIAKNEVKVKEIGIRYKNLGEELNLTKVRIPIDKKLGKALFDYLDLKINFLLNQDFSTIIKYISIKDDVIPKTNSLNRKNFQSSFFHFAKKINFDINKNIRKNKEENDFGFIQEYSSHINLITMYFFNQITYKLMEKKILNHEIFINYFIKESWLGHTFIEKNSAGEERSFCWLELLSPAFEAYFHACNNQIQNPEKISSFVLCIDSLCSKIEGILRYFAQLNKINTIKISKEGEQREMLLDDLLGFEELKNLIGEDDIEFIKYVLTSNGMNIRNNVAHCFYKPYDYSFYNAQLLILTILRLSKFKINTEK